MARGRIAHAITFVEDVTSTGNASQQYPLGTLRMEETSLAVGVEVYRYVQHNKGTNSVATVAGALCYRGKTIGQPWTGCSDSQQSAGMSSLVMGLYQAIVVDTQYCWIKTKGYQSNVKKQTGSGLAWVKGAWILSDASTTATGKAKPVVVTATTKVSGADIRKILQRNIGFAATAISSTTATGKLYVDLE